MHRPAWVDDDLYPFADRWAALPGGAVVHHVDEGEGTPILMVHGNPTWSFLYRDVIAGLRADGFRCVAVDLPGFGLSPAPPGYGFRAAEHAAVLAELIAQLELDGYLLMGQDWGGPIGLAAAGRAPGRLAGLVLGNTWGWSMAGRPAAYVWAHLLGGVPGRLAVERLDGVVGFVLRRGARRRPPAGAVLAHYELPFPTAASRRPVWTLAREVTGASDFLDRDVAPILAALGDRPALLPWGDADPVFGDADRDRLAAALPRARVHDLPGAGHFIQEDAGEEVAAAIRAWWAAERP
ncbi:MAG TPA: alpha/beta fold hydrolase [Solirubrobacteraceae bacterium]